MKDCKELVEEYKKTANRSGYRDLRSEPWPEQEEAEDNGQQEQEELERRVRPRREEREEEQYSPSIAPDPIEPAEASNTTENNNNSMEEPDREESLSEPASSEESQQMATPTAAAAGPARAAVAIAPNTTSSIEDIYRRSVEAANRLDGLPTAGQPMRWKSERDNMSPYMHEYWLGSPEEEEDEEEKRRMKLHEEFRPKNGQDYWEINDEAGILRRHHNKKRKSLYDPRKDPSFPVKLSEVEGRRRTTRRCGQQGQEEMEEDEWQNPEKTRKEAGRRSWKGHTDFFLTSQPKNSDNPIEKGMKCWLADRRRPEEVDLRFENKEALEGWKQADLAEWRKLVDSKAVKVLSLEESLRLREELKDKGQLKRILPSRMLRKYKHADQPGEPAAQKSRLCIRGDQDPDLLNLDRFSPTINTMNMNAVLQIAANKKMRAAIGDLKNAFCQSDPLQREGGTLYFSPPKGCLEEELDPRQLVVIINGCYGLVDAPRHWRQSLVKALQSLGYRESRMDPCLYRLHHQGELVGMIAVEVDDLFTVGTGIHHEQMKKLRSMYQFGKWVELQETEQGASFNGRRIRQTKEGGFCLDMQKFVEERLQPIEIEPQRKKQKEDPVTEEERSKARTVCGALNWLSKEGRPDASAAASLFSSKISHMKVQDLLDINGAVAEIKKRPALETKIQPLRDMRLAVITDALFGNHSFHS
jgi:hypothetical protein